MSVSKIDGIGTRKDGSGGETANFEQRRKFARLFLYVDDGGAETTHKKGDWVAIETNTGSGYQITVNGVATNAATYWGLGNACVLADMDSTSHDAFTCGVLAEEVTIKVGQWQAVSVQVEGIAYVATDGNVAIGDKCTISSDAGAVEPGVSAGENDAGTIVCIALETDDTDANNGTSTTSGTSAQAILLNPLQL
tara:strand:+ start:11601 stop:12182 length:582 start_codon:yes stop_codon:yes gene_type:complete